VVIRSTRVFSGVAEGTTGRFVMADSMRRFKTATEEGIEYDVAIEWDLPERPFGTHEKHIRDWFSEQEYEDWIEEIKE
jgi:hypothetical protein